MTGINTEASSGYLTLTSAMTTAVYPTDLIGGSSTTAGNSIFTANSSIVINGIETDVVATTAGTITLAGHAGVTVFSFAPQIGSVGRNNAQSYIPLGNGIRAPGFRAISATTVGATHKIFFTVTRY